MLKIILDIKTLLKHLPTILYNLLHEITGFKNCTVINVECTMWIVLTLENHMDSCIDLVGPVTFVEIFSRKNLNDTHII